MKKLLIVSLITTLFLVLTNMYAYYKYTNLKVAYHKAESEKIDYCKKLCEAQCQIKSLEDAQLSR